MVKKIIIGALVVIVVLLAAFWGIAAYTSDTLSKSDRKPIADSPSNWGLEYESASFTPRDEKRLVVLRGWYIPASNNKEEWKASIVMVHGRGQNRHSEADEAVELAPYLVQNGYNVILFDLRGHGESDGDRFSLGYFEKRDVLGAIRYLRDGKKQSGDKIGVLGFSMGAASGLLASTETDAIGAIVADSSFAQLRPILDVKLPEESPLPEWVYSVLPLTGATIMMGRLMFDIDLNAVKPVEAVRKLDKTPILFIHGADDETIPVAHARQLHKASPVPQHELWVCGNVGHVDCYDTYPEEYKRRILEFFDKYLKGG